LPISANTKTEDIPKLHEISVDFYFLLKFLEVAEICEREKAPHKLSEAEAETPQGINKR
jgi:hypothetical protein